VRQTIGRIHRVLAWIVLAGLVFQVYLAGVGLFGADSLDLHREFGFMLELPVFLMLILALVGRLGRQTIGMTAALVVLMIIQAQVLPALDGDLAWVAALHPVNALALMGLAANLGRGAVQTPATSQPTGD
jgi:hypothetical protein